MQLKENENLGLRHHYTCLLALDSHKTGNSICLLHASLFLLLLGLNGKEEVGKAGLDLLLFAYNEDKRFYRMV